MWRMVKVLFWIAILALVIVPLLANSLYLDRNGISVPAEVTAKNERISRVRERKAVASAATLARHPGRGRRLPGVTRRPGARRSRRR